GAGRAVRHPGEADMRVLINGVSALKPRTGVGHTTAHLHRALSELCPSDSFWLYPGEMVGQVARRFLSRPNPPTPFPAREGGDKARPGKPLPGPGRGWGGVLISVAKAAYRVHFQTVARWGTFDLYHEPNFVPIRTHLPTVVTVHDLSV